MLVSKCSTVPYTTLFRSEVLLTKKQIELLELNKKSKVADLYPRLSLGADFGWSGFGKGFPIGGDFFWPKTSSIGLNLSIGSEEHTSELQTREKLVCRLLH